MRADRPWPAEERLHAAPLLGPSGRAELFGALFAIAAALYLLPAVKAWLAAEAERIQTSALAECRPPAEFEQLHVVVANRAGRLVGTGCLYVGTPGSYVR